MEITEYDPRDKDEVLELLCIGTPVGYKEWRAEIWEWQYAANPFLTDSSMPLVLLDGDRIVGFYGTQPVRIKYGDEHLDGVWGCDYFIHPSYRGKGLGTQMARAIHERHPVVAGFGISDRAVSVLQKVGRRMNEDVDEFFYQNKVTSVKELAKKTFQYYHVVKNRIGRSTTSGMEARVVNAAALPRTMDTLWQSVEAGYSKAVARDYAYVKWKYRDHPIANYQAVLITNDDELLAVGIFRQDARMSRLVDYIGPAQGEDVKASIIATFITACAGSRSLNCICSDEELKHSLAQFGFRRFREKPAFAVHSRLPGDEKPERDWFIMAGDSDEDLLLAAGAQRVVRASG
jgi:GNAT superfamily N-acetyltransferase